MIQLFQGTLHISGDGLRVADSETKGLVLDQTIEKVSFCAPDRNFERGFSYICRDGTTRRSVEDREISCYDPSSFSQMDVSRIHGTEGLWREVVPCSGLRFCNLS